MSINYLDKTGLEHIGDIANYKKRNIDYITYTGTDLEIEDTLENKINFNNLYGQTEQDSYEGKNLFNKNSVELGKIVSRTDGTLSNAANYNASDYIPMKENTTYTLTSLNFNRWYSACYDENKNYIGYVDNEATFTTISGTKYMRFTIYNNAMDTAMIVEGTELPDYEPYVGGTASPNPDYPQEVKTVTGRQVVKITGKNLLDASQGRLGTFNNLTISYSNGNILLNGTSTALVDFYVGTSAYNTDLMNYMNNNLGTYTLSNNLGFENYFRIGGSYLQNQGTITSSNKVDLIFIRIPTGTYDNEILNIQIEKNSTATDYEEYKEQNYELNLGKNLFDIDGDFTYGGYSDVPIINNDGTLTSNANYSITRSAGELISLLKPNTNYILSAKLISTTSTDSNKAVVEILQGTRGSLTVLGRTYFTQADSKTISFTTPNDTSKIWISISSIGANTSSTFGKIQLEKGEEATSYSPYFTPIELCKIGNYQDSIKKSTGKNLNDGINDNFYITGTGTDFKYSDNDTGICIEVEDSNYTISTIKSQTRYRIACSNSLPSNTSQSCYNGVVKDGTSDNITINTTGYKYLLINCTDISSIMINEGSTALPYEPYGVGKWYVEKKIGKVVLDGSEEWIDQSVYDTTGYSRYRTNINTNTSYNNGYDNRFTQRVSQEHGSYEYLWLQPNTGALYIQLLSNRLSEVNLNGFKTWLSNNNVILYYQLSTSTVEEITDEELIEQLNDLHDAFYMNSKTYINVEGDLPIVLEINHDKPRFLNLIDKGELQKYIMDLEKRVAILESQITE